jgi:hypothetical protein
MWKLAGGLHIGIRAIASSSACTYLLTNTVMPQILNEAFLVGGRFAKLMACFGWAYDWFFAKPMPGL